MAADARRVAVITGASSGIGKETAKALAAQGWRVIGIGRDSRRSTAAEEEIHVLFARALAKRLADDGIVAHAMHPGTVDSNFITHADERTQARIRTFQAQTPAQGADTLIWLATAEEPGKSSGGYFYQRKPRVPNPVVDDDASVDRLWTESEKLIAKAAI